MEPKTATLTHKVRNPQNLDKWLDIWTATTIETVDGDDIIYNYKITPSANWNISADNLSQIPADKLGQIPVNKISSVNFQNNIGGTEKNYTTTNVTITSEPVDDNLGLRGGVALTKTDGSISERPFDNESDSYLNGKGTFISLPSYSLTGATDASNVKLTLNKNNEAISDSNIIINGSGKITTTYNNSTITLDLAQNSVGTNELQDNSVGTSELQNNSVTPEKIDWDYEDNTDPNNPITMTSKIKQIIDINSFTNDGIVPATNGDMQLSWATDNSGNPAWRSGQITIQDKKISNTNDSFLGGFIEDPVSWSSYKGWEDGSIEQYPEMYLKHSFLAGSHLTSTPNDYIIVFRSTNALTNSKLENNETNTSYDVVYS